MHAITNLLIIKHNVYVMIRDFKSLKVITLSICNLVLVGKNLIFDQQLMCEFLCIYLHSAAAAFSGGNLSSVCIYYHLDMICCSNRSN